MYVVSCQYEKANGPNSCITLLLPISVFVEFGENIIQQDVDLSWGQVIRKGDWNKAQLVQLYIWLFDIFYK